MSRTRCSSDKIRNPESGRCVQRDGRIGRRLTEPSVINLVSPSVINLVSPSVRQMSPGPSTQTLRRINDNQILNKMRSLLRWLENKSRFARGGFGKLVAAKTPTELDQLHTLVKNIRDAMQGKEYADFWIDQDTYNHPVAVKIQKYHVNIAPQQMRAHWHKEAQIHKKLASLDATRSLVPKIYASMIMDSSDKNLTSVMIMDLISGYPLDKVLNNPKRYPTIDLQKVYDNINRALIQIWKQGVMHLDLHGDNLMVHDDSSITVIDFGLARELPYVRTVAQSFEDNGNAIAYWEEYLGPYTKELLKPKNPENTTHHPNSLTLTMIQDKLHSSAVSCAGSGTKTCPRSQSVS